jgi:hypothetical protein
MKNTQNIIEEIQNLKSKYCVSAYLEIKKILGKNGIIENKSEEQEIQIKLDKINILVKYDKVYSHKIPVENYVTDIIVN